MILTSSLIGKSCRRSSDASRTTYFIYSHREKAMPYQFNNSSLFNNSVSGPDFLASPEVVKDDVLSEDDIMFNGYSLYMKISPTT